MSDGSWSEMFNQRGGKPVGPAAEPFRADLDDIELAPDLATYRPWTLQRGRGRPAMMLELRRYEPRSGLWSGWQMSYPTLVAAEYIGDRVVTLDFGTRQFVIEGQGLDELARQLQQGTVVAVQEYAPAIWAARPSGPFVKAIRRVTGSPQFDA